MNANDIAAEIANELNDKMGLFAGGWPDHMRSLRIETMAIIIAARLKPLVEAAESALSHTTELRDAWMRGSINECDGRGGTRSNRNVDVEVALRKALGHD